MKGNQGTLRTTSNRSCCFNPAWTRVGTTAQKLGRFELAHNGTLFLATPCPWRGDRLVFANERYRNLDRGLRMIGVVAEPLSCTMTVALQ
jgi:hypothetical protein